jgi:hypothetical protein
MCSYARSKPNLVAFVERALGRFFPEHGAAARDLTAAPGVQTVVAQQ